MKRSSLLLLISLSCSPQGSPQQGSASAPSPIQCPPGTVTHGFAPPTGIRQYCTNDGAVKHGPWRFYFPNGQLQREGYYSNGRKSGRFTSWHTSGVKTSEGIYKKDRKFGIWREWTPAGHLRMETPYVESEIHGYRYFFYSNGNKSAEFYYVRGQLITREEFSFPGLAKDPTDTPFLPPASDPSTEGVGAKTLP